MKDTILVVIIGMLTHFSNGQIINANPDPNGEVWIVGKIPDYTQEFIERLNEIPELELSHTSEQTILPFEVDNSLLKYMRPIFTQTGNCCAPAAGVAYNFTFEISRIRNIDVSNENDTTHYYPTHYTYNFLNNGSDNGSSIIEGWDIIKEHGCPTVMTWGGMAGHSRRWMTGYENYDTSFYNRLISYFKITITDSIQLDILKHWISDHNEGDSIGGLSNFTANMSGIGYTHFPEESPEAGKWLIAYFGDTALHALTIVGYNDSVRYDFNEDNTFTKNIDINDDDTVDLRDWEFGAVKVANSWGTGYADEGFVYVPYRLLAENSAAGGITLNQVYVIHLDTTEQNQRHDIDSEDRPDMVLRLKMEHPQRSALKFRVGYGQTASDIIPYDKKLNYSFSQHGGPWPMQGINEDPIEIEFDFPYYFNQFFGQSPEHFGKVFLEIEEYVNLYDSATFLEFSLKDYRWNDEFELNYNNLPHYFLPGSGKDTLLMGIEYDLIPFEMVASSFNHYNFTSNKICRRDCTATDSAEVTFGNGINVDFYNGTLVIGEDASLTIGDNVTIHSHTDADSIIVYGQLEIGGNVNFIADKDTALVIEIRRPGLALQVDQASFQNVDFSGFNDTLAIDSCHFKKSNLRFFRTTEECLILTNSRFDTTEVKATVDEVSLKDFGTVMISGCHFQTDREQPVITIEAYKNFELIRDSLIYTSGDGIRLHHSGSSTGQSHLIKDCYIQCESDPPQDSLRGIMIYHSYVDVETNYISGNTFGVGCLDMSNITLTGDENATNPDETQQIIENDTNQVYILPGSFPYEFEYNVIYRTANDDSLVYFNTIIQSENKFLHVESNYWGEDGLDTVNGLIPSLKYFWEPVWDPSGHKSSPADRELFHDARQAIIDHDYAVAESNFKEIIEEYPESNYVEASVKELLPLKRIYDQDFSGLQAYLADVSTLWEDEGTARVTDHVINWCNIEKEDYVAAINWFEAQIDNPASYEDSICAIIDLGYTYLLMDMSSQKSSSFVGKYVQHRPVSRAAYENKRDHLVDLLFNQRSRSNDKEDDEPLHNSPLLQQNYPNPASSFTTIDYFLPGDSQIRITLFDALGRPLMNLVNSIESKGKHTCSFDTSTLSEGIYYYSFRVNNVHIDVKKLILIR